MATKRKTSEKPKLERKPLQVCSGGKVTVKPGQSRYEAQQAKLTEEKDNASE